MPKKRMARLKLSKSIINYKFIYYEKQKPLASAYGALVGFADDDRECSDVQ